MGEIRHCSPMRSLFSPSKLAAGSRVMALILAFTGAAMSENAEYRGLYNESGYHDSSFDGYYSGWDGAEFRSFFVFNIPALTVATSATLTLWNPQFSYFSVDPSETYTLWSVETDIDALVANQENAEGIFDDLGSGVEFGSINITASDDGTYLIINLNEAAIQAINAAAAETDPEKRKLAIGGSVTSLTKGNDAEVIFDGTYTNPGDSNTGPTAARLTINPVPEPTTAVLLGLSAGAVLFFRRRR
jgi:hypothetical protein